MRCEKTGREHGEQTSGAEARTVFRRAGVRTKVVPSPWRYFDLRE